MSLRDEILSNEAQEYKQHMVDYNSQIDGTIDAITQKIFHQFKIEPIREIYATYVEKKGLFFSKRVLEGKKQKNIVVDYICSLTLHPQYQFPVRFDYTFNRLFADKNAVNLIFDGIIRRLKAEGIINYGNFGVLELYSQHDVLDTDWKYYTHPYSHLDFYDTTSGSMRFHMIMLL